MGKELPNCCRDSSGHAGGQQRDVEGTVKRTIRAWDLWSMGVGAVISGDFFGWQSVLAEGFGSGLLSTCFATLLYFVLVLSVAEVASTDGLGGGPCHFAEVCFGRHVAFFVGLAESLKCVTALGVVATAIASYVVEILHFSEALTPLCWFVPLAFFTTLNVAGGSASRVTLLVITWASLLILGVFYIGAFARGVDVNRNALGGQFFSSTTSVQGVFAVWPFSLWFYLGIEELPLATNVTIDPQRNVPRGLLASFLTLAALAFGTLVLSSSIPRGAEDMAATEYPLLVGYSYIFDIGQQHPWWLFLLVGLAASLHSFVFATGQLLAQMAEDGYFPPCLALRMKVSGAPWAALVGASTCAYVLVLLLQAGEVLISMCLFSALLSYSAQLCCLMWLRWRRPYASRAFTSPLGAEGAGAGVCLCVVSFAAVLRLCAVQGGRYLRGLLLAIAILECIVNESDVGLHPSFELIHNFSLFKTSFCDFGQVPLASTGSGRYSAQGGSLVAAIAATGK